MTAPSTSSTNDVNAASPAYEDLEKIHEDDLEAIDLKWYLSLLSIRAKRYFQRTGKKIFINANDTARKQGNNEDTSSKEMLAIDGVGFDWSDMAKEQVQKNMALVTFLDSELNQTEFTATTYKRGLETLEEQLITNRKNEVLFSEEVAVLKREVACKDYEINVLKSEFEKVKQEKEGIKFKIEKFYKASKDLDKLLGSRITDKSKKGLGYNVVPPPHPLIYNRPKKLDLSYSGLDEFKEPEFKAYGSNVVCDKKLDDSKENSDDSLVKEQVSKDTSSFVESSLNVDKETVFPVDKKVEFCKPKNHEKPAKKLVRYAEMYRSQTPKGNQRNWNGQKSNQLGTDFVMYNKACFICGSFDHVQAHCKYHQRERMDDTGFVDSGCSRHMTGNIAYLLDFKEFDGGYITFGGGAHGGRISSKGTLKTDSLDFKDILLKIPRKDNMYNFDMKNIVPKESFTCLVAKATLDESMLLHSRLGHINFKNINKLVKDNLIRELLT
ncbi:ribonuclease H-like domain-containing protein, partial [Tanacetum coccineum]